MNFIRIPAAQNVARKNAKKSFRSQRQKEFSEQDFSFKIADSFVEEPDEYEKRKTLADFTSGLDSEEVLVVKRNANGES